MFTEIDEDSNPNAMSIEEVQKKFKNYAAPKGLARTSFMVACERLTNGKGPPKKTLNRIHYQFLESALLVKDPEKLKPILDFIHDRIDGKPGQRVEVTGDDGGAIKVSMIQLVPLK